MRPLTPKGFAEYVESLAMHSRCWRSGSIGLYPALAWINAKMVVVQRELVEEHGVDLAIMMSTVSLHNRAGIMVAWTTRYMVGPSQPTPTDPDDFDRLFNLAGRVHLVRDLLAEVRQGVRSYEQVGRRIVLRFTGDARLDALDRLLTLTDTITDTREPPDWSARLRDWYTGDGLETPWAMAPEWAREELRAVAKSLIAQYPSYLPEELDVGGFTMAEATAVLSELLARGQHMGIALQGGSIDTATTVSCVHLDELVADLSASTGVPLDRAREISTLLTVDLARCPDPCLTPLVPLSDDFTYGPGYVVLMTSLMVPSSPVRNFTALLQDDPARFGAAGQALGALGSRTVASTLRSRLRDAAVATSVPLIRDDRSRAGDLDVVACDAATGTVAVFEILWRIGPDGSAEVAAIEEAAHAKRAQVTRVRNAIKDGSARPRWPAGWPDVDGFDFNWFILSPSVLPVRAIDPDEIIVRSHELIARMLPLDSSVRDLVELLIEPRYPPEELTGTNWRDVTIGRYKVEFDVSNAMPG